LATPIDGSAVTFGVAATQGEALRELRARDYDYAPVRERNRIVGRVARRTLRESAEPVRTVVQPLTDSMVISADAPIRQLMRELRRDSFLFVVDGTGISGLVTSSDLNKESARAYMFLLITDFEIRLASATRRAVPDQDHLLEQLTPRERLIVSARYAKQRNGGVAADIVACMSLSVLVSALPEEPAIHADFGYKTLLAFKQAARRVVLLRNEIDHATGDLVRRQRDLERVIRLEDQLRALLTADSVGRR